MPLKRASIISVLVSGIAILVLLIFINLPENHQGTTAVVNSCEITNEELTNLQEEINKISSSGGGTVSMKACKYNITEPLILKSNVHLKGAGVDQTQIVLEAEVEVGKVNKNKVIVAEKGAENIGISDMTIDGNKQHRKSLINDPYAHTIDLGFATGFTVDEVKIINSTSASIILYNSRDGIIKNSTILDSGSNGILALKDIQNVSIENNLIDHTDHQNGIFISYQDGYSSTNVKIANNVVKYAADFGIEVGHIVPENGQQHRNVIVKNNKVVNATNAGIAFRTVSDGTIEGNSIEGYGKNGTYGGDGIFLEGGFNTSENITVLNNKISQNYHTGDANAIYLTGIDRARIEGNTVKESRGNGLFVQASVLPDGMITSDFNEGKRNFNEIAIKDNEFNHNKKSGIQFQGNYSAGNSIQNNKIKDNAEFGVQIANLNSGKGFLVSENTFSNNKDISLSVYKQSDITIIDNQFKSAVRGKEYISFVNVQNPEVKANKFLANNWDDVLHEENVSNLISEENQFE